MNELQGLWWQQANSDLHVFQMMRREGFPVCHSLHYLQMSTEKIAKAYFWRTMRPPPRSHAGFVQFLRFLAQVKQDEREHISQIFSYKTFRDFRYGIRKILAIAYELERIAPDLANDGPNTEYPWPHHHPAIAPVSYDFPVWHDLEKSSGRELMRVLRIAIERFPEYADK